FNNILATLGLRSGGSLNVAADSLGGFASDFNAVQDRFTPDGGATGQSLAQWRAAAGQDRHSFTADPAALFVSLAQNDFRLAATSPARDAGIMALAGQAAPANDQA